jgi:hypothetical protein
MLHIGPAIEEDRSLAVCYHVDVLHCASMPLHTHNLLVAKRRLYLSRISSKTLSSNTWPARRFIIAAGFALAAIAVMLVQRFGHVMAYWLAAGGLTFIGAIASIVISVKEHAEKLAEQQAAKSDTEEVIGEATTQALVQTPMALLGGLMAMPGGATGY